jgi:hypothetical protein
MRLILDDIPLKSFLMLFHPADKIQIMELGDTWHPSSGFIDESVLGEIRTVDQILNVDYDFKGLVYLEATLEGLQVKYHHQAYALSGDRAVLEKLVGKIKMLNPDPSHAPKYSLQIIY